MKLLDKSPGGFVALATFVVYGTILTESWMLTTASLLAMAGTMVLVVVVAAAICRSMMNVMGSEEYSLGHPVAPSTARLETVEASPAARQRPVATGRPALNS